MNTNTKFPNSAMPQFNKFGMHMPPVYRVLKPSEVPAERLVDEEGLEYSDVYPLQYTSSSFSHKDISNNNPTVVPNNTFVLTDYIKKP
jgi:hypothetical protein